MLTTEQRVAAVSSPLGLARAIMPGWQDNWHQDTINSALERVFIGQCKRLIINVPPRSGKTTLAVKAFMAWATGLLPDCEWIHASYSKRLAAKNTYETRALMQSEAYCELFPGLALRDDGKAKDEFYTSLGGVVYATGAGGTITGYGAGKKRAGFGGAVIIDDPLKADDAFSDTMRQNVNDWYMSTMQSRLNSPDTPVIVIMQRLHEDDLTGFLLSGGSGEEWEHIVIPALNERGESFWEAQLPASRLLQMREANSMVFAGQYMQTPAPMEGGIFKTRWFEERHLYVAPFNGFQRIVLSLDSAFKTKDHNDPSALTMWGEKGNKAYLIGCDNVRLDVPSLIDLCERTYRANSAACILVEDKASGQVIIPALRDKGLSVIPINPERDKVARAMQASPACEAGRIILPKTAPYLMEFEQQLFFFPNSKHDDMCLAADTLVATARGNIPICDVLVGDMVITPDGYRRVTWAGITGFHETISRAGINGTPGHPIYSIDESYQPMHIIGDNHRLIRLNICGLTRVILLKMLSLMERDTSEWVEAENIISRNQQQMWEGSLLRVCMLRYGSIIRAMRYRKATMCTIKTATHLIALLKILIAYRQRNIIKFLRTLIERNAKTTSIRLGRWQQSGIPLMRGGRGIENMLKIPFTRTALNGCFPVLNVVGSSEHFIEGKPCSARTIAASNLAIERKTKIVEKALARYVVNAVKKLSWLSIKESRNFAPSNAMVNSDGLPPAKGRKHPVYNLTVEGCHCFFANGVLVHNCDATSQFINWWQAGANHTNYEAIYGY